MARSEYVEVLEWDEITGQWFVSQEYSSLEEAIKYCKNKQLERYKIVSTIEVW